MFQLSKILPWNKAIFYPSLSKLKAAEHHCTVTSDMKSNWLLLHVQVYYILYLLYVTNNTGCWGIKALYFTVLPYSIRSSASNKLGPKAAQQALSYVCKASRKYHSLKKKLLKLGGWKPLYVYRYETQYK